MEENIKRKDRDEIRPKTIFSGNGNGLTNFTFLSTREQKNVHTVCPQDCVCGVWEQTVVNLHVRQYNGDVGHMPSICPHWIRRCGRDGNGSGVVCLISFNMAVFEIIMSKIV